MYPRRTSWGDHHTSMVFLGQNKEIYPESRVTPAYMRGWLRSSPGGRLAVNILAASRGNWSAKPEMNPNPSPSVPPPNDQRLPA